MQLYRLLWIYIAIHDLGRGNVGKGASKPWNPAYRTAAIKIAQELTPLLIAGGELDIEQVDAGKSSSCWNRNSKCCKCSMALNIMLQFRFFEGEVTKGLLKAC